jgi:hypothetical protein
MRRSHIEIIILTIVITACALLAVKLFGVELTAGILVGLIATLLSVSSFFYRHLQRDRKYRVLVPMYASRQEYLDYINHDLPTVQRKVARDILASIESAKRAWFQGNSHLLPQNFNEDSVDFYCYPEGFDQESYENAFKKALYTSIKEKYDVIGVIGHVTSTVTRACGPLYAKRGLPIILPLATEKYLAAQLKRSYKVPGVIRLVPNNSKQAERISKFLLEREAYRAIIVKDKGNTAYSDDLVESFRYYYVRRPFEQGTERNNTTKLYSVNHGRILSVISAGGEDERSIVNSVIENQQVDALIVVGMAESCLDILAQAREVGLKARFTLLTDGTVDEYLLPQFNRLINDQTQDRTNGGSHQKTEIESLDRSVEAPSDQAPLHEQSEAIDNGQSRPGKPHRIYTVFPIDEPMFDKLSEQVLNDNAKGRSLKMTYSLYVVDAVQIFLTVLFKDVVKASYPFWKPPKAYIADTFNNWASKPAPVNLTYDSSRVYKFDQYGDCEDIEYHIYYVDIDGALPARPGDEPKWKHDHEECRAEHYDGT